MGKSKGPGNVPNRPTYSRISYLYQAAAYLASHAETKGPEPEGTERDGATLEKQVSHAHAQRNKHSLSRRLITDLRSTSLKSQIRLSPSMKHTICKFCDSLLIEGETSNTIVENKSKGCKKPWADVLVVKCHTCGGVKRFPVQAPRQKRRPIREKESEEKQRQQADATTDAD
ncbi:Rpr2-domain-containing protein [Annulohypoxylon maeteangense]|uniref:Rpr2-domain-containing protein n=1 Tax=Annulohypoxylon maeteangense TaxID=1927788 RepID=UPI002007419F|nr:Rpr2-domain-containing protein [Annulohypoxylon maeteangense]KAI0883757.1 Rpr2-domain-containing protein [Annulohypoxylon maeteangense]